ncbi:hypothetical protein S7711_00438 [Stachybotrys chartarum IBT 7711]|uniref:Large ribosomal subunit protein uL23m n=1 Tax=Stachybotrys chartarum (strain CBS 109288 / IBT 7711) TaxID=1280523 RepID=A0A084B9Q1_STACB|nr:hypothetical protein S7711_00438 [Stachybotrys chartarum IBT 7711]KFA50603.1 hypothetical protein S40293_08865 [Stachybotrys chartarum IBT 40293]KFA77895.1 hypothetical protein S40288_02510 [Stachybotrys chartarum IBT 40288]
MAEAAKRVAAAAAAPSFKLGKKEVFLPNHVITFLHKPNLPPHEACFKVPLRFTKFDIRDYLWNLYNVEVTKVRSLVQQQALARRHPGTRSVYRPRPLKFMTVELAKPFQWPEAPSNLEPWGNELWKTREELGEKQQEEQIDRARFKGVMKSQQPLSNERKKLAELAKQMIKGEVKWNNDVSLDPKWDKLVAQQETKDVVNAEAVDSTLTKNAV